MGDSERHMLYNKKGWFTMRFYELFKHITDRYRCEIYILYSKDTLTIEIDSFKYYSAYSTELDHLAIYDRFITNLEDDWFPDKFKPILEKCTDKPI